MDQHLKEFYERLLRECEQAWRAGNLPALVDAANTCIEADMPPDGLRPLSPH